MYLVLSSPTLLASPSPHGIPRGQSLRKESHKEIGETLGGNSMMGKYDGQAPLLAAELQGLVVPVWAPGPLLPTP